MKLNSFELYAKPVLCKVTVILISEIEINENMVYHEGAYLITEPGYYRVEFSLRSQPNTELAAYVNVNSSKLNFILGLSIF